MQLGSRENAALHPCAGQRALPKLFLPLDPAATRLERLGRLLDGGNRAGTGNGELRLDECWGRPR